MIITTLDDLDHMQDTMADNWPVVVEDKSRRVWTLIEDVGVLWANHSATWRPAQEVLAAYGPLRVLQDLTEQVASESRRWQRAADASATSGPPCKAGLMIKGEHFPCDWPTSKDGTHGGWAHTNKEVEAVWREGHLTCSDEIAEGTCDWFRGCEHQASWVATSTCECRTTRLICDAHHDRMVSELRSTTYSTCCYTCGTRRTDAEMVTWRQMDAS